MKASLGIAGLFGILFLPFVASCTAAAFGYRSASRELHPDVATGGLAGVPDHAFVAVTGRFTRVAEDRLPLDGRLYLDAPGAKIYAADGAREVVVYCKDEDCAPLRSAAAPVRLEGRVCPNDTTLFHCTLPHSLGIYLSDEEKRRGLGKGTLRVFLTGDAPSTAIAWSWFGFGGAAFWLLLYAGCVTLVLTRRRKTPPLSLDLALTVVTPGVELQALLTASMNGVDAFRIDAAGPGRLVFTQGHTKEHARLMGMMTPEVVPRTTTITWTERPYHPTSVQVRIEDRVTWFPDVRQIEPLIRSALARTADQVRHALRA